MKIGSGFPPLLPSPSVPPANAPLQPFSDFYGDPTTAGEGGTFGFAELGMFGLSSSRPITPVPVQAEPRAQSPSSTPLATVVRSVATSALLPAADLVETVDRLASARPIGDPARPGHPSSRVKPAIPDIEVARIGPVDSVTTEGAIAALAESDEYPVINGHRLPDRSDRSKSGVSVLLHEKEGDAELVVGAPPLDPGARSILRQLVRAILARSGLKLARFQLNGTVFSSATLSDVNGDTHGFGSR